MLKAQGQNRVDFLSLCWQKVNVCPYVCLFKTTNLILSRYCKLKTGFSHRRKLIKYVLLLNIAKSWVFIYHCTYLPSIISHVLENVISNSLWCFLGLLKSKDHLVHLSHFYVIQCFDHIFWVCRRWNTCRNMHPKYLNDRSYMQRKWNWFGYIRTGCYNSLHQSVKHCWNNTIYLSEKLM